MTVYEKEKKRDKTKSRANARLFYHINDFK